MPVLWPGLATARAGRWHMTEKRRGKARVRISKELREAILKEYRHLCAVCGGAGPHLHHVDEDPSNNDPLNLLPVCPNCHLVDVHNPTTPIEPLRLRLFRQYKDPVILSPQFKPLFKRLRYLLELDTDSTGDIVTQNYELIAFLRTLEKGDFFSGRVSTLLNSSEGEWASTAMTARQIAEVQRRNKAAHLAKVIRVRESVIALIVEMLVYQGWPRTIDGLPPTRR
jgi:hypothetical protein